jgi:hypothetical protein
VAESCPLLKYVAFSSTNITDATVVLFSKLCPLLTVVILRDCDNLTDVAILAMAERLPGLTSIDLSFGCELVSDSAIRKLAESCPSLRYF